MAGSGVGQGSDGYSTTGGQSWREVLHDGEVYQVYPDPKDVANGITPLYFTLMHVIQWRIHNRQWNPRLMVALGEINSNSTFLPGYSLHYTLSDNAVGPP